MDGILKLSGTLLRVYMDILILKLSGTGPYIADAILGCL
jgi:hypothetical protein